jgi:hypothetical protein
MNTHHFSPQLILALLITLIVLSITGSLFLKNQYTYTPTPSESIKEVKVLVYPTPTIVPTPIPTPISSLETEFKTAFINGCIDNKESNRPYCTCNWDYLYKKYGMSKIYDLSMKYEETKVLPFELVESSEACSNLYSL